MRKEQALQRRVSLASPPHRHTGVLVVPQLVHLCDISFIYLSIKRMQSAVEVMLYDLHRFRQAALAESKPLRDWVEERQEPCPLTNVSERGSALQLLEACRNALFPPQLLSLLNILARTPNTPPRIPFLRRSEQHGTQCKLNSQVYYPRRRHKSSTQIMSHLQRVAFTCTWDELHLTRPQIILVLGLSNTFRSLTSSGESPITSCELKDTIKLPSSQFGQHGQRSISLVPHADSSERARAPFIQALYCVCYAVVGGPRLKSCAALAAEVWLHTGAWNPGMKIFRPVKFFSDPS